MPSLWLPGLRTPVFCVTRGRRIPNNLNPLTWCSVLHGATQERLAHKRNRLLRSLPTYSSVRILIQTAFSKEERKRTRAPGCRGAASMAIPYWLHRLGGAAGASSAGPPQHQKDDTVLYTLLTCHLFDCRRAQPARRPSSGGTSLRRDCHFADALSPPLLKHLLKGEGGAAE